MSVFLERIVILAMIINISMVVLIIIALVGGFSIDDLSLESERLKTGIVVGFCVGVLTALLVIKAFGLAI